MAKKSQSKQQNVAPKNFKPSPINKLIAGAKVRHTRYGSGRIIAVDGVPENRIATILFSGLGEKRIMLKYAKLEVIR